MRREATTEDCSVLQTEINAHYAALNGSNYYGPWQQYEPVDPQQEHRVILEHIAKHGLAHPFEDHVLETRRRAQIRMTADNSPELQRWWLAKCRSEPAAWLRNWLWVYNEKRKEWRPFRVDDRIDEFVRLVIGTEAGYKDELGEPLFVGLDKSRGQGATVTVCAAFVWIWRFEPEPNSLICGGLKIEKLDDNSRTWGSSTFAKLRCMIDLLPDWMRPESWRDLNKLRFVDKHKKLINADTGAQISAMALGVTRTSQKEAERGGRSRRIWVDEANSISGLEDALQVLQSDGQIVMTSSVKGRHTGFSRYMHAEVEGVTGLVTRRWHYRDHPDYDPRTERGRKAIEIIKSKMPPPAFAAEWEIDYNASMPSRIWAEHLRDDHSVTLEQARLLRGNKPVTIHAWDFGQGVSYTSWLSVSLNLDTHVIVIEDYHQWTDSTVDQILGELKCSGWYAGLVPDHCVGDPSGKIPGRPTWNGVSTDHIEGWIVNLGKVGIRISPQPYNRETEIGSIARLLTSSPARIVLAPAARRRKESAPSRPNVLESLQGYRREGEHEADWDRKTPPRPIKDQYSHIADCLQHVTRRARRVCGPSFDPAAQE